MPERVLEERPDGVRIIRVRTSADAAPYRASFAGAYQDIFSEPPYNERMYPEEASGVLKQHLDHRDNIVLLAVSGRARVLGFCISVPVEVRADIARELRGLIPIQQTHYLADIGVLSAGRGTGLGSALMNWLFELLDLRRFRHMVLRTSAVRNTSYEMYMRRDFIDMGVYMEVGARRQSGKVTTDRRLFLHKVLPAPDNLGEGEETEEISAVELQAYEDRQKI